MSNLVKRIQELIPYLPIKDIDLGYKFLSSRDFESLKDLIDSAIIKVKRNLGKENPREEYLKINIEKLQSLKAEVDTYYSMLEIPEQEYNDFYEDYNDEFNENYE